MTVKSIFLDGFFLNMKIAQVARVLVLSMYTCSKIWSNSESKIWSNSVEVNFFPIYPNIFQYNTWAIGYFGKVKLQSKRVLHVHNTTYMQQYGKEQVYIQRDILHLF